MSAINRAIKSALSLGAVYPTVSGMLIVVAPALIAISIVLQRKSYSVRVASIGDHWMLSQRFLACVTVAWILSAISSLVKLGIAR